MAANGLEVGIARLEGAYEQVDKRLATIEGDIRELRGEVHGLRVDLQTVRSELLSRMDRQFFWVLGLLIISILLPVATRTLGR